MDFAGVSGQQSARVTLGGIKVRHRVRAAGAMVGVRFLGRRIPLFLSWSITNRCNYRCAYCDRPNQAGAELSTARALEVMDEFAALGTRFVFVSGGEPLVRKDAGEIIERCRAHRLFVCLTTNAALYLRRKHEIGRVDMLKISLDGSPEAHDAWRAAGSYDEVIEVLADARRDGIPVLLNPVVSTATLPYLEHVISVAERFGARVKFQPVNYTVAGVKDISALTFASDGMREVSSRLLALRRRSPAVANSRAGLRYMATLPAGSTIGCYAGRLFVYLMPNGDIYPCNKRGEITAPVSCAERPVAEALERLPLVGCRACWCTSDAELNLLMRFDPFELLDLASRFLRKP
jgi:MoaA/NifB/PqqE/SkfB family radical SAM enzyme